MSQLLRSLCEDVFVASSRQVVTATKAAKKKIWQPVSSDQCDQKKSRQISIKVAQNGFIRKMKDFDNLTKIV